MKECTILAPAKINLYLEVKHRRPDGYHDLESTMHTVGLYDEINVRKNSTDEIILRCSDEKLPCGSDNLAYRAAAAFLGAAGIRQGVTVSVKKNIPCGAGMGGGSADAAGVLVALNTMYDGLFSDSALRHIGKTLGADVPFCLYRGAAEVHGIGEILIPCRTLPSCTVLAVQGDVPVSTPQAFKALDRIERTVRHGNPMTALLHSGNLFDICAGLYNAFELVQPSCEAMKKRLRALGADGTLMSGSGSSVFALFSSKQRAEDAAEQLRFDGKRVWACPLDFASPAL